MIDYSKEQWVKDDGGYDVIACHNCGKPMRLARLLEADGSTVWKCECGALTTSDLRVPAHTAVFCMPVFIGEPEPNAKTERTHVLKEIKISRY